MAAKRKVVIKDHFIQSLMKETASLYVENALSGGQIATFHENTDIIAHNCEISGYPKLSADKQSLVRNAIRPDNGVIDYESLVKEINSIIDKQNRIRIALKPSCSFRFLSIVLTCLVTM